jgi:hypothetical protein
MTDDSKRGQTGRWTAGEQFVSNAPLRYQGALYGHVGAHTPDESGAGYRADGGHNPQDVPGHGRVGGIDDPVAREDYGGHGADRPPHVRPTDDAQAAATRECAARRLRQAADVLDNGGNTDDAKMLIDAAWSSLLDVDDLEDEDDDGGNAEVCTGP